MTKLYFNSPQSSGSLSYLRGVLPVKHLKKELLNDGIEIAFEGMSDSNLPDADVFVFANCPTPETVKIIKKFKRHLKIVWQLDDNFWNIVKSNPAGKEIGPIELAALEICLSLADHIWVTTQALADLLSAVKEKVRVVPNLVDMDDYTPHDSKNTEGQPKRILWRGSPTHASDLTLIEHLPHKMLDYDFMFIGMLPSKLIQMTWSPGGETFIAPKGKNVGMIALMPPNIYRRALNQYAAQSSVALVPLQNNVFNESKSNLAVLEFMACGLPVVASNVPEYAHTIKHGENGFLVDNPQDWEQYIELASQSETMGRAAFEYVRDNWSWQSEKKQTWADAIRQAATLFVPEIQWGK